jgi:hypothetical protein
MKKHFKLLALSACILASTAAEHDNHKSATLTLGSPASFLEKLGVNEVATERSKSSGVMELAHSDEVATFTLPDNLGKEIEISAKNFSMEENGTLSMHGEAVGIPNSEFILQGNGDNVYGWVILRDQDTAYEYTTEEGDLVVNEIAITDVHPTCNFEGHDHIQFESEVSQPFAASGEVPSYPGSHLGKLESKPGSSYVIFLDTTKIMRDCVPYDVSKEFVWTTWQVVAASFSMFDVNVTTNENVYNNAAPSKRGGANLLREEGRSSCHYAFGTSTFCTLYKKVNGFNQGIVAVHELGHLLHLKHDGGGGDGEYYRGIAEYQWVPIMGSTLQKSWSNVLYQWSKGEYSDASNKQDDFTTMTRYIPFERDDITSSRALNIDSSGNISVTNNTGLIEQNTDSDSFSFTIGENGGHVNFNIDRVDESMLDVQAHIKDSSGSIIASSNRSVNRSATFDRDLTAGNYTLEISGGAEGSPRNGFSNYSSLGDYGIAGKVTGTSTSNTPNITNIADGAVLSGPTQLFSWGAGSATGFKLYAGSSVGAKNYYSNDSVSGTSVSVTGLPVNGETVHVSLSYLIDGVWAQSNHTYIAVDDTPDVPVELGITSPVAGSTLAGATAEFTWNQGDASKFLLYVGSREGSSDYYRSAYVNTGTSETATNLPVDGSIVHLTFWSLKGQRWSGLKYTYTAGSSECTAAPSRPGKATTTVNSSTSFTANWDPVNKATSYGVQLWDNSRWKSIDTTAETTYSFTDLRSRSRQYIRVNATNSCGSSQYSKWVRLSLPSVSACSKAPTSAPVNLAGNSGRINWSAVSGATSYDVQYWSDASRSWIDHGSSASTSYTLGLSGTQSGQSH